MTLLTKPLIPCDVDDTLIMHVKDEEIPLDQLVEVEDHVTPGKFIKFRKNMPMIRCVLEEISNGAQILIWSRGKLKWAANVAVALGLDKYDILVSDKPTVYFDNKDVSEWMKDRVWLNPDMIYKDCNK